MNSPKANAIEEPQPSPAGLDTILVVEDVAANIDLLLAALGDDYAVSVALDGAGALKSVASINPDLILLDVMMPGMDGYEVCGRLKQDPATRDIPVIFLTALNEDADEERGLRLGAVDYITKPFHPGIVKARVRNHLALRRAGIEAIRRRDQIEAAYQKLHELEHLRDDLVHMIVHDMRSPLTGLGMFLDMMSPADVASPGFQENLRMMREACQELCGMVSSLLDVSRLEAGRMPLRPEAVDLGRLADTVLKRSCSLARGHQVSVHLPTQPVIARCDPGVTERVIQNLLGNALKFTPKGGQIRIEVTADKEGSRLSISDSGPGIPPEYHEKVFQKFGQVEARKEGQKHSTGLGLTFCKLAAEAQGGGIQLESEPGQGATFHLRLPRPL